jgi:hypothetical protein
MNQAKIISPLIRETVTPQEVEQLKLNMQKRTSQTPGVPPVAAPAPKPKPPAKKTLPPSLVGPAKPKPQMPHGTISRASELDQYNKMARDAGKAGISDIPLPPAK